MWENCFVSAYAAKIESESSCKLSNGVVPQLFLWWHLSEWIDEVAISTGPIQFDLEQIATEWISTEMHSNHHGVSAGPKSPHLSIVDFFLSAFELSTNFQQKIENKN